MEAERWDYLTTDNRDVTLESLDDRFDALEGKETALNQLIEQRRESYIIAPEKFSTISKQVDLKDTELRKLSTSYANDLVMSRNIHEKDYLGLSEEFTDSAVNKYSHTKLATGYFESANRMECHLTLDDKWSSESDVGHVTSCMKKSDNYSGGDMTKLVSTLSGIAMFFIVLANEEKWKKPINKWEKLPNDPEKRKDTKKKSWLPRRRKMKQN